MTRPVRRHSVTLLAVLAFSILLCNELYAQKSTRSGSAESQTVRESYGYSIWQVDQGNVTTTLQSELGVSHGSSTPIHMPVTIPGPSTVHAVHGNVALSVWPGSTCARSTILTQLRDQAGNAIVSLDLVAFSNESINIPVSAVLGSAIPITSLSLQATVRCAAVTLSWSIVMN